MFAVAAALCGLALLWSTALSRSHAFPDLLAPSIGDVRLVNYTFAEGKVRGTVQIYYEDGVHVPQWGYVCKSSALTFTAQVVCRQLGYSGADLNVNEAQPAQEYEAIDLHQSTTDSVKVEGGASSGNAPPTDYSDDPVWLSDIHCGENSNFSHILRCNHTVSYEDRDRCDHLIVGCIGQLPESYNGQVRLCSPSGFRNNTQSTSFGVAQVYFHKDWGGVNQYSMKDPLGSYEADSICRQLGYTNAMASYTMTVESAKAIQSLDFETCESLPNTINAWFKTDDSGLKCERSQDCFGCCFPYPSGHPCSSSVCSFSKDVVVKCEFDPTIAAGAKGGNAELCHYNNGQLPSQVCSDPQFDWKRTFVITVGAIGSLAVVLLSVLLGIAIGCCVYCVRRRGNRARDRDGRGQQRLLRQQDDEN